MELHYIADDLEDHAWYVELVADFVEDVQRFAAWVADVAGDYAKELSRRVAEEIWSAGKLEVIDELFAPSYRGWEPTDGEIVGPAGFRELVERYRSAFADTKMTADRLVAEGDWVTMAWTARGTHTGELMGIPPTGRDVTVTGVQLSRIADGRFVEGYGVFDALGLLQQVGAVPTGVPAHA